MLSLAALAGCRGRVVGRWPQAPIILISIDTLRADRLPLYGYADGDTPHLDTLAKEGVVFERVVSPVPLTLPAHASLLTGLLPPHHGVRDNLGYTLSADHPTLATRFHEARRPTGAAVSAFVLRGPTGIGRGFDLYDDALTVDRSTTSLGAQQRDGAVAVETLARWIEARPSTPFFAFLHLYEPHTPYAPPAPYAERFAGRPYDGEVAYADALVGRLLARLKAAGAYDRAVLVVTSDHGEGLGDHGEQEHGLFLYREAIEVPLIVRLPAGARAGTRVGGVVSLLDVPATLLDLVGLPVAGLDGRSLRPALAGEALAPRPAYSESFYPRLHFGWSELLAVSEERFRFIRAPRPELYDVAADPGERRNLAAERTEAAARMAGWLERVGDLEPAAPDAVSPEVEEALRALGYVGGGRGAATTTGAAPDPKDKVEVYEAFRRGAGLLASRREAEAVEALQRVVAAEPEMLDAWESLGGALLRLGRRTEAIAAYDHVLQGDPERASAHIALAQAHALAGRHELALQHATAASARDPGRAFELLAQAMLAEGRLADAAEYARRSVAADPERAVSHFVLGVVARRAGDCTEALEALARARQARQRQKSLMIPGLDAGRGDCLARLGHEAEAEQAFRDEIAEFPFSREGRVGLALLLRSQGRDAETRDALAGLVAGNPRATADDYLVVVRTLASLGDVAAARDWAAQARGRFPGDRRFAGG